MKIFFGSHAGKDISELDSSYIIWIIESYEKAEWLLINECKKELSSRLKLDWEPPTQQEIKLSSELKKANVHIDLLEKIIFTSATALMDAEKYIRNPELLESDVAIIKLIRASD